MAGYTPVFDSVFHGTLCGRWPTLPVWLTILPMADKNGHIDMTYTAMSALTGWPIDLLKQAIAELMAPDPESRTDANEGRRLELLDPHRSWGWRVVNHEKYREKARKSAYDAERVSSGRDAERKRAERAVPRCPAPSRAVPLSDSDANTDTDSDTDTHKSARDEVPHGTNSLDEARLIYPMTTHRADWGTAWHQALAIISDGEATGAELLAGARRFRAYVDAGGVSGPAFVMTPQKFFVRTKRDQPAPWSLPWTPPQTKAEAAQDANLAASAEFLRRMGAANA